MVSKGFDIERWMDSFFAGAILWETKILIGCFSSHAVNARKVSPSHSHLGSCLRLSENEGGEIAQWLTFLFLDPSAQVQFQGLTKF